jgi:ABC-type polar amino acid transport system ATPase subunit
VIAISATKAVGQELFLIGPSGGGKSFVLTPEDFEHRSIGSIRIKFHRIHIIYMYFFKKSLAKKN